MPTPGTKVVGICAICEDVHEIEVLEVSIEGESGGIAYRCPVTGEDFVWMFHADSFEALLQLMQPLPPQDQ